MDEPKVYVCFEQDEEHCENCGYAECCEFCKVERCKNGGCMINEKQKQNRTNIKRNTCNMDG